MLWDLNEGLLKANRLEKILKKLSLFQLVKEPTQVTSKYKTLIDVMITYNINTVIQTEMYISIADHRCMMNRRKQRMKPFKICGRKYANY